MNILTYPFLFFLLFPPHLLNGVRPRAEDVPLEMREPLYRDQYEQEHLKPSISKLLVSPEIYCRAHALLLQVQGVSAPPSQGSPGDAEALLQLLEKKGLTPKVQGAEVTLEDLSCVPIRTVGGRPPRLPVTPARPPCLI